MAAAAPVPAAASGTLPSEETKSKSTLFLALDWSMASPAAAARLYSPEGRLMNTWLMCFQQRRATPQKLVHRPEETFEVTVFPMYNMEGHKGRWDVVKHHCDSLQHWFVTLFNDLRVEVNIKAFIEDYAYGVKKTNSFTKLAEDAGCAQLTLASIFSDVHFQHAPLLITPVNIKTVKKFWTGSGDADKMQMYHGWLKRGLAELRDALRCNPGDNPYSDIVDAVAVLETGRAAVGK